MCNNASRIIIEYCKSSANPNHENVKQNVNTESVNTKPVASTSNAFRAKETERRPAVEGEERKQKCVQRSLIKNRKSGWVV